MMKETESIQPLRAIVRGDQTAMESLDKALAHKKSSSKKHRFPTKAVLTVGFATASVLVLEATASQIAAAQAPICPPPPFASEVDGKNVYFVAIGDSAVAVDAKTSQNIPENKFSSATKQKVEQLRIDIQNCKNPKPTNASLPVAQAPAPEEQPWPFGAKDGWDFVGRFLAGIAGGGVLAVAAVFAWSKFLQNLDMVRAEKKRHKPISTVESERVAQAFQKRLVEIKEWNDYFDANKIIRQARELKQRGGEYGGKLTQLTEDLSAWMKIHSGERATREEIESIQRRISDTLDEISSLRGRVGKVEGFQDDQIASAEARDTYMNLQSPQKKSRWRIF